ncbi:MAG TPA: hypothetical protein VNH14_07685, partial [Gemmatimonadales bacterium]|nr:hypothetical protein [Gemmatimonadales bacterium]
MLRTVRLIDAGLLSAAAVCVAACAESGPTAPTLFRTELITCQASVTARTLTCGESQAQASSGINLSLILGGQGALVRLASSGTAYNGGTQAFTSDVTVENLIAQPMNTTNGTTPDAGGIKVFFNSGPTVTGGSGVVTVTADGVGTFTGVSQPYYQYSSGAILASGATTSPNTWHFAVPTTVTRFEFQVFIQTTLPDEVSPIVALGLSRSPAALSIAPGGSGPATVTVTRTNYTGAVTLSLGGAPLGVTGSFSPAAPTGTSSTLTVNVGNSVGAGVYPLTIDGTSTAGPRHTTLTLTVGTGGSGNVTWDFSGCPVADKPAWVAAKNGTGAWARITGTGDVYNFTIGSSGGGVAYVVTGASGLATLTVQFMTQAEFTAGTFVTCPPPPSGKTIHGSVTGTSGTDITSIALGGQPASASFGTTTFTLNTVPDGNQDLVAYSHDLLGSGERAIIRRSQNFADNSTIPVLDFGAVEAFTPATATITLNGLLGGEEVLQQMSYQVNANCATAFLYSGGAGASFPAFGIPSAQQDPTDFHALEVSATTSTGFRSMTQYNHTFMARTLTLGAVL